LNRRHHQGMSSNFNVQNESTTKGRFGMSHVQHPPHKTEGTKG
jgi:hypothetical protein